MSHPEAANRRMKELPAEDRPREKLLRHGAGMLTTAELLAVLLRTGTRNESVMRLAERIIAHFCQTGRDDIMALWQSPQEIRKIKGIGAAKAATVAAALELGTRLQQAGRGTPTVIRSPEDVAVLLMPRLRYERKECFLAVFLSTKNHVLSVSSISVGTLSASLVHPRELFREACVQSAAAMIVVHNHPSGDATPSGEDISLTRRLTEAGSMLDIPVLDHVVIGDGTYVSMKEKGYI